MAKKLFFIGFGLLPLWVFIYITLVEGYSIATHWYLFFAIPPCAITLSIAFAASITYEQSVGNSRDKFSKSAVVFAVLTGLAWYVILGQQQIQKHNIKEERHIVEEFVRFNEDVIRKTSGVRDVYISSYIGKAMPDKYIVAVYGSEKQPWEKDFKAVYAVVDVSREGGTPKFTLACFTVDSTKKYCEQ
jgi:hypothetical protein